MPLTIKRTNTVIAAANSVLFNGSNQYLTVGNTSNFNFLHNGLSNWTVEGWIYFNTLPGTASKNWISDGANTSTELGMSIVFGAGISNGLRIFISRGASGGPASIVGYSTAENVFTNTNTWYHVAVTFNTSSKLLSAYINGTAIAFNLISTYQNSVGFAYSNSNSAYVMAIGRGQFTTPFGYFDGYMSNTRVLNGTALYTASFSVPTTPLTAIANTSLLTCNAATIIDGSTNNFTITNNNSATVSSTTPFAAASPNNNFQFVNRNNNTTVLAGTQKAIFGYGYVSSGLSMTNLVSNVGVVANDTTGVGTGRYSLAAAGYGSDKAIFGYGNTGTVTAITNLVSNTGVVASNTTGVGTARDYLAAAGYGSDKAIFGYGTATGGDAFIVSITNLVSNTGVVATDTTGVGTARGYLAAAGYGSDKAIFGYGYASATYLSITNKVSNTGVVSTNTTGVGTIRGSLAAAGYGNDKAIFGYGNNSGGAGVSMTNLVSNTGVVSTDTTGVGTVRNGLAAAGYGSDKAIFGYGANFGYYSMTNLVSNTGVVSTDTTGVGTSRTSLAAAGFSITTIPAPSGFSLKKVFADPTIITSGLVLNLDASNVSSYPGSGTSWFDLSGNGNNGILVNGVGYNSANGGALTFDGVDDFVRITLPSTTSYNTFTYNSWIYSTSDSGYRTIIDQDNDDWALFSFDGQLKSYDPNFSSGYTLNLNQWYNVVMSHADGGPVLFYVNGSLVYTSSNTSINHTTSYFGIGAGIINPTTADEFWSGRIAQASIYNRPLSASEVLQNYNITKARFGL